MASLFQPVDGIVGEVFPELAGLRAKDIQGIAFEEEFEAVRERSVFDQSVVIAEVKVANVGPFAEVGSIGCCGDLGQHRGRVGEVTLFGIPTETLGADQRRRVRSDAEIDRALPHDGIRRAVVESAVHHHIHAPTVEARHKSLELGKRTARRVGPAEHGRDRPIVADRVRTARVERRAGRGIGVAALDADGMDGLQPQHVDAERGVVVLVERVRTSVVTTYLGRNTGVVDQIEKGAASGFGDILRLDDERIDLIHVGLQDFLRRNNDGAVPPLGGVGVVSVDAVDAVAHLQAVDPATVDRQRRRVITVRAGATHGVSAEISIGCR